MRDRRPTARADQLRRIPCASDNSLHPEHPRFIHSGGACPDCRIWRLAAGNRARSILFVLVANAEAERQAVVLQRHSNGYDRNGVLRAVRSSDWFAKENLCNEELMNSKQRTYGGEITPPVSHGEGLISSVACPARQITPLSPRGPSLILSGAVSQGVA